MTDRKGDEERMHNARRPACAGGDVMRCDLRCCVLCVCAVDAIVRMLRVLCGVPSARV